MDPSACTGRLSGSPTILMGVPYNFYRLQNNQLTDRYTSDGTYFLAPTILRLRERGGDGTRREGRDCRNYLDRDNPWPGSIAGAQPGNNLLPGKMI